MPLTARDMLEAEITSAPTWRALAIAADAVFLVGADVISASSISLAVKGIPHSAIACANEKGEGPTLSD
jgi:NADPH-dependent 7-cyano-7-deazaguanine reductase QueF-like protein